MYIGPINSKNNDYSTNIASIPVDVFKHCLLTRLELPVVWRSRRVCRKWKATIESRDYLEKAHPKLSFLNLGSRIKGSQFMSIVQHYRELDTLDLRQCYSLTDEDLEPLTNKKFRALHLWGNPLVTEDGLLLLLFISSIRTEGLNELMIGSDTNINILEILSNLLKTKINFNKLCITEKKPYIGTKYDPNKNDKLSEAFCKLIQMVTFNHLVILICVVKNGLMLTYWIN